MISKKTKKRIEIVGSYKSALGSMGHKSRKAIHAVLSKHYTEVKITILKEITDLEDLVERKPDLVFLGMKYIPINHNLGRNDPDKIWITDYLDGAGVTYTGSNMMASELEQNKDLAKFRVKAAGLATSSFYVAKCGTIPSETDISLNYPLFVKPTNRGGGEGINNLSMINNYKELTNKLNSITSSLKADSLIEQFLPGREFSVAILKDIITSEYKAMPIEKVALVNNGPAILSEKIKSSDSVKDLKVTDLILKNKLTSLALNVFHVLGARDFGRIDIRLDEYGEPQFLEANLIPSLIENYGSFPKACKLNNQMEHEEVILRIVKLALTRKLNSIESAIYLDNEVSFDTQPMAI